MEDLHIDPVVNEAINNLLESMKQRSSAYNDLLLFIPLLQEEGMIISFGGEINSGSPMSESPELALATAQKGRCDEPFDSSGPEYGEMVALNDALVMFERFTGREYLFLYVPQWRKERITMTRGGVPYPDDMSPEEALAMTMIERRRS